MFRASGAFVIAVILAASDLSAQAGAQPRNFAIHRDEAVYVAAFHYEDDHAKRGLNQRGVGDYLSAEQLVRREFDRSGVKTVDRPSDADYVFVVYVHDRTVEGLAIEPGRYRQAKAGLFNGDLDPLRDAASARYVVGPFKLPTIGRMSERLVQQVPIAR